MSCCTFQFQKYKMTAKAGCTCSYEFKCDIRLFVLRTIVLYAAIISFVFSTRWQSAVFFCSFHLILFVCLFAFLLILDAWIFLINTLEGYAYGSVFVTQEVKMLHAAGAGNIAFLCFFLFCIFLSILFLLAISFYASVFISLYFKLQTLLWAAQIFIAATIWMSMLFLFALFVSAMGQLYITELSKWLLVLEHKYPRVFEKTNRKDVETKTFWIFKKSWINFMLFYYPETIFFWFMNEFN